MNELFCATRVEVFKLRRTLALWSALLVPAVVIAMTMAMNLSRSLGTEFVLDHPNGWDTLMLDQTLVLWCFVLLPLFVALEAALLAGLEHRENTWKHLFALPVRRWTIYVSKLVVGMALVCLSSLVLAVGTAFQGWLLLKFRPDLGVTYPIPWNLIILRNFGFVPAVLLLLAIQLWVAIRWRSFTVPMSLGISGTLIGVMLLRTLKNSISTPLGPTIASLFPWSLPYIMIAPMTNSSLPEATARLQETALLVGMVGGVFVSILGCWETLRRDVP
jgi:lantibiotic transport system permease protein